MKEEPFILTLDIVKSCIEESPGGYKHKALLCLCNCWYNTARDAGESDHEAAKITLHKLITKASDMLKQ